jgi:leader peptidase (prepilin peptidase)/N-methyltransferase
VTALVDRGHPVPVQMIVAGAAVLGLLIGSFLNVVIHRVPVGESVVSPRSRCPGCGTELAWHDNVPVVSWLVLRARCRTCEVKISARYPFVEAGCAALFAALAARIGWEPELAAYLVAAAAMLALSVIDVDTKRLPDVIVLPATAVTAALLAVAAAVGDHWGDLGRAALGAVLGFAALFLIHVIRPDGLGFGDVKLALLCGLLLGWFGLAEVALGLYGGFALGAIVGVTLIAAGRARFGRAIPFGPFLVAGTLLMVLVGDPLADATRDLFA